MSTNSEKLQQQFLSPVQGVEIKSVKSIENLVNMSKPPTEAELNEYEDVDVEELPAMYKRKLLDRIFVNRDLRLDRIKWIGFDMDYTLAQYKSPQYESMSYDLTILRLIQIGYPESIKTLKYDETFPIRGLLFDTTLGHLLKIDTFGNILVCLHGRVKLNKDKVSELYPSLYIPSSAIGNRFYPMSTLFNLPEACLYADLITHLEEQTDVELIASKSNTTGKLSYLSLYQDVRNAMDYVHQVGQLKVKTQENMAYYVKKSNLFTLLDRLRKAGIKLALITNSEYSYTKKVMEFLLEGEMKEYADWKDYWDVIIVNARKPTFFAEGTTLREVTLETGHLKIGMTDHFERGHIYSGGSLQLFEKFTGARGNQVLYVGDHIYADIIKSKKVHAWRNLLIIPELEHELKVWNANRKLYSQLMSLEYMKAAAYKGMDSSSTNPPDISALRKHIKATTDKLNDAYNPYFGSLFRSGSKQSQFSMQVMRYADLYTYDIMNLLNYPLFYPFTAQEYSLPHEYVEHISVTKP